MANNQTENPIAIATVVQVQAPTSAKPGDKAWVNADGSFHGWVGGGCVQPAIIKLSKQVTASGQPCLLRVAPDGQWEPMEGLSEFASGCLGRGSVLLFVEPLSTQPTLCVMGDSAIARSLVNQAVNLKLNVILQAHGTLEHPVAATIDVRTEFEVVRADYIVIATQGKKDKQAIANALACECSHISMVVSQRKLDALKEILLNDGLSSSELERLKGPAGIRIGAQLPEEIALSVLAEIIQLRRSVDNNELAENSNTSTSSFGNVQNVAKSEGSCCDG